MTSNFIELDQTLHGYDNGHHLLASSLRLEPRDERALLIMSDLSGPRAIDNFLEYLTGYMLPSRSHYALAKTWYATEMARPGCVWTHTFLIPIDAVEKIQSLEPLTNNFFRPRLHSGYRYSDRVELPLTGNEQVDRGSLDVLHQESVACGIENLYSSDEELVALIAGSGTEFEGLALRLWSQLWPSLRNELSFCTGSLAKRSLLGKPLVLQCGPDRIIRDMRTRPEGCQHAPWVDAVISDLEGETSLRAFLITHGSGLTRRSAVSKITRTYLFLQKQQLSEAIRFLVTEGQSDEYILLDTVLKEAVRILTPIAFLREIIDPALLKLVNPESHILHAAVEAALHFSQYQALDILNKSLKDLNVLNRREVISALADNLDSDSLVNLADSQPDLFSSLLEMRVDLCYTQEIWKSHLPLLDKIDIFETARARPDIDKVRLVESILQSQDPDICSEIIAHLSAADLPVVIGWLVQCDWTIALRPQWLSFLRKFQVEVAAWANNHLPSKQILLILANVLDISPTSDIRLSEQTVLLLASEGRSLISERHDAAAFIYVTTTSVQSKRAASFCFNAFAVLHRAIAESRLSNRAWQLLELNLMPLPGHDQWDGCEKLRRAVLYFTFKNQWPSAELWRIVSQSSNLFYDFLRTAKSYKQGRTFFAEVRDAGVRGELQLSKQQFKEIRKLL